MADAAEHEGAPDGQMHTRGCNDALRSVTPFFTRRRVVYVRWAILARLQLRDSRGSIRGLATLTEEHDERFGERGVYVQQG